MTTMLLIRHGHHLLGSGKIAGRMPGVHLSPSGIGQVNALVDRLQGIRLATVYSSPLERTRETAEILCKRLQAPLREEEAVLELNFGDWEGQELEGLRPLPHWQRFNSFRSGTLPPNGEWMLQTQTRIVRFLLELRERHPEENVAVVSHADVIKSALAYFLGVPLDLFQRMEISPASISAVCLSEYGPFVLCVNETGGLPPIS